MSAMRSGRVLVIALLLVGGGQAVFRGPAAVAFPAFKRQFDAKYLVKGAPLYGAYGGRSNCNVCHLGGAMDREHRNDYGQALDKLLDRTDAEALSIENARRDPQAARAAVRKIDEALGAVEKLPANTRQKAPPTFGQLIREGKLPISPMTLPGGPPTR
jgi:hypothetical protein